MNRFVYALWGDDRLQRRGKALEDVLRWMREEPKPEPRVVYSYGQQNWQWLADHGIPSIMTSHESVADFDGLVVRDPTPRGGHNYGYSHWRHKTEVMATAMEAYNAIVWLDWDCHLTRPLPGDFWDRMAQGQPIQMSIVRYQAPHCHSRRAHQGRRIVPEGAFIYCRDPRLVERANELYDHPRRRGWSDQAIFAEVMDEIAGEWPGVDGHKAMGFEPYCHAIYCQYHAPADRLFVTTKGRTHGSWLNKQKRREAIRKARAGTQ